MKICLAIPVNYERNHSFYRLQDDLLHSARNVEGHNQQTRELFFKGEQEELQSYNIKSGCVSSNVSSLNYKDFGYYPTQKIPESNSREYDMVRGISKLVLCEESLILSCQPSESMQDSDLIFMLRDEDC